MESISKNDILRPMTEVEVRDLIEFYKSKNERYHHESIYNNHRWNRLLAKGDSDRNKRYWPLKRFYYTHRYGNLAKNGTFICLLWDGILGIQFHTFEESLKELKECFAKTKLIDWKSGPLLISVHSNYSDEIARLIVTLGGIIDSEISCICHLLPQSIAINSHIPDIPEGYKLFHLEEKHANLVHANWPHNDEASVDFIRGLIEFNITLGIFRQKDDKLVACIFQNEFFGVGILQVVPEERNKGFAKLLSQALAKKISMWDTGEFVTAFIGKDNIKSLSLARGLGYEQHCISKWIRFKNLNSDISTHDPNSSLLRSRL